MKSTAAVLNKQCLSMKAALCYFKLFPRTLHTT